MLRTCGPFYATGDATPSAVGMDGGTRAAIVRPGASLIGRLRCVAVLAMPVSVPGGPQPCRAGDGTGPCRARSSARRAQEPPPARSTGTPYVRPADRTVPVTAHLGGNF